MARRHTTDDREKSEATERSAEKSVPTESEESKDEPTRVNDRPNATGSADGRAVDGGATVEGPTDDATEAETPGNSVFSRRSALKLAGLSVAAVGSPILSQGASAASVVDAVEDLGWDPNGNDPIEDSLASVYGSDTTVQVPPGDYRISGTAFLGGSASNFTLEGTGDSHTDVTFVADKGFHGKFFEVWGDAGPHTFRNFSIQQHDDTETSVSFTVIVTDGLLIEDVEHLGFTPDDGDGSAGFQMAVGVENSGGTGTVRRYYNREGGQIYTYPDRQAGCWIGGAHNGVITLEDCVFIELGGSCIYGSRHNGTVRVEGGYYANNDHHDMRISNERSDTLGWIRGATFVGDYSLVNFSKADAHEGGEGTWIEHGDGELLIEDCDYVYRDPYPTNAESGYTHFPGVIHVPGYSGYDGDVTFRNCRFRNGVTDASYTTGRTIAAGSMSGSLTVEGCSFTGGAPEAAVDATSGIVQDTAIEMSDGGAVTGGIDTSNVTNSGAAEPSIAGLADVYPGHSSIDSPDGGSSGSDDGSSDSSLSNTIELVGTGVTTNYEFTVSEALQGTGDSIESWDDISGTTATGYVTSTNDRDAFEFDGEVTAFTFHEGEATVSINGEQVDPATLGEDDGSTTEHSLELVGTGTTTNYEVTVSGDLAGADDSLEPWDDVTGSTANGYVTSTNDRDAFTFTGEITDLVFHQGEATVLVDGEEVDPGTLEPVSTEHSLELVGTGTTTNYEFTVSGDLAGADDSIEPWDDVSGSTATGYVTSTSDRDAFTFTGEVTAFTFHEGEATVYLDGEQVDPATAFGG